MNETLKNLYFENLHAFRNGKITEEVWANFCRNILAQIMTAGAALQFALREAKKEKAKKEL